MKNNSENCATWIWYAGDYEIWLANTMNSRRTERGVFFPPFWKMDSHYVLVEFSKQFDLQHDDEIVIAAEGQYNIKLDGKMFPQQETLKIPAGRHSLHIKVYNQTCVPAIFVDGKYLKSDSSWRVTCEDKEWIDESGKASDTSATEYLPAGHWNFNSADDLPSKFRLQTEPQNPVSQKNTENGTLYDFGKETFGYIVLNDIKGSGKLNVFYGESPEEALDTEHCETFDKLKVSDAKTFILPNSRAFRYVYIDRDENCKFSSLSMLYEFLPEIRKGSFRCNDELLNKIFDVSAYTLHLTTREFFIDGIKRDRWTWSGDAMQSYLMNYYLFFDVETVKRTVFALRGKDPVTSHINTIVDYTFYWFISIYDYYQYSGDSDFLAVVYPRMKTLMDYCLRRRNANGMLEGLAGDWIFIDWADFPMSKQGEVSVEQLLFYQSLRAMEKCAELLNFQEDKVFYNELSENLQEKIFAKFWDKERNVFIHNIENDVKNEQVTPFVNMFAVLFNFVNAKQREQIRQNVLLNPDALKITTPYMRFYELEALCLLGEYQHVLNEIRAYWGGMLSLGATSFWEKYNPAQRGAEHLEMYGRPYGKSLCHSWGASPLYLFGKYLLGIKPEKAGYKEFSIRPQLCDLQWIEGVVPTPNGEIKIFMDNEKIKISATEGAGFLYFSSTKEPKATLVK